MKRFDSPGFVPVMILALVLNMAVSPLLLQAQSGATPALSSEADAAWAKVQEAIKNVTRPAVRPKTREEYVSSYKAAMAAFDESVKNFLTVAPQDSRRWKAKLFVAGTISSRGSILQQSGNDPKAIAEEILKAPDADAETKGNASALLVQMADGEVRGGKLSSEDWIAMAEAHIKQHPESKANTFLAKAITGMRKMEELKTKPLDLKFTALDGSEVDLAKMRGKVILIDFWAVWCGPCVAELPNVIKTYEKLHPKGFEVIGISLDDDKAKLESFLKDKGMTWPQYFDGKSWNNDISSAYGIRAIPAMWLVDKKGMVVSTNVRGKLEAEVEKYLAE